MLSIVLYFVQEGGRVASKDTSTLHTHLAVSFHTSSLVWHVIPYIFAHRQYLLWLSISVFKYRYIRIQYIYVLYVRKCIYVGMYRYIGMTVVYLPVILYIFAHRQYLLWLSMM